MTTDRSVVAAFERVATEGRDMNMTKRAFGALLGVVAGSAPRRTAEDIEQEKAKVAQMQKNASRAYLGTTGFSRSLRRPGKYGAQFTAVLQIKDGYGVLEHQQIQGVGIVHAEVSDVADAPFTNHDRNRVVRAIDKRVRKGKVATLNALRTHLGRTDSQHNVHRRQTLFGRF